MRKMRKLIMLFMSFACVGAISAVSFAAWVGGNNDLSGSINFGSLQYLELSADAGVNIIALDGSVGEALYPVDQGRGVRFLKVSVVVTAASVDYKVGIMQHQGTETEPYSYPLNGDSGLYILTRDEFLSKFPGESITYPGRESVPLLGGTKLTSTTAENAHTVDNGKKIYGETLGGADTAVTHYFYLYLASDDLTDMGKQLKIDIVIAAKD